jgi:hypothetical protein
VPVGQDEDDLHLAVEAALGGEGGLAGALDLRLRRQERLDVGVGPRHELHVRELEAIRRELLGHGDDRLDVIEVRAVQDDVQGEREAELLDPAGDPHLGVERREARDGIRRGTVGVLDAQLHVVDRRREALEARAAEGDAARDEVHVKAERAGMRGDGLEVGAGEGLAAGQVKLHDAKPSGFVEHTNPVGRLQLVVAAHEGHRVGAVRTRQRATVRQLRNQRVRGRPRILAPFLIVL